MPFFEAVRRATHISLSRRRKSPVGTRYDPGPFPEAGRRADAVGSEQTVEDRLAAPGTNRHVIAVLVAVDGQCKRR
jgi:hypothetical protein